MITTTKAAEMLGVTGQTIRRLIYQSKLTTIKTEGGKFRVSRESVEKYVQSLIYKPAEQNGQQ